MRYLLLFLLALPAFPVAVWGPVIGDGNNVPCHVTAATNATPIHITVGSNTCGLANNATIWVYGVINTGSTSNRSSANIHAANSSDSNGLARMVKNLSGTSFDLYDAIGTTAVAGNGTWSHGGLIARVVSQTTKGHPTIYFDGPGGTVTTMLSSSSAGGYCDTSRAYMSSLNTKVAAQSNFTLGGYGFGGGVAFMQALKYWCNKGANTANRDNGIDSLMNSLPLLTPACTTSLIDCGYAATSQMDYNHEISPQNYMASYSLLRADLSSGQRATFVANVIDDKDWTTGGYGYTGQTRTIPSFKTHSGCSISYSPASADVTGSGCRFTTETVNGDLLFTTNNINANGNWIPIASRTNDNLLTLAYNPGYTVAGASTFLVGVAWTEGTHIGWIPWGYNTYYNPLCGQDLVNGPLTCPDHISLGGSALDINNHTRGRLVRAMQAGLAIAEDDIRGQWLFTNSVMLYYHLVRPIDNNYGGVTETGPGYTAARIWRDIIEFFGGLKMSLVGDPDFTNGNDDVYKAAGNLALSYISPISFGGDYSSTIPFTGMVGFARETGELWWPGLSVVHFRPDLLVSQNVAHVIHNVWPALTAANINHASSPGVVPWFVVDRPDVTQTAPASTVLDMTLTRPATGCVLPAAACYTEPKLAMASRSSYVFGASAGSELWIDLSSNIPRDHAVNDYGWPHFDIHFNTQVMTGGDDWSGYPPNTPYVRSQAGTMLVGGESNLANGVTALNRKHASSTVAMISVAMRGMYTTKPTTAHWTVTHAKVGTHGFVLARYEMTNGSSVQMGFRKHYNIIDTGTPASNTAITVASATPSTVVMARPSSGPKLFESIWGCTPTTVNGPLADGSYSGQSGNMARYDFLASSGTSATCYEAIRYGTSSLTAPTYVKSTSGSHEVFEVKESGQNVVVFSAPAATSNLTTCSVTTTWTGTGAAICQGLAPGTYETLVDGSPVSGCGAMIVVANDNLANCASGVPAGALVIQAASGGSPMITNTSPLTSCTVGVSCTTTTFAATGGAGSNVWTVASGSLPAGLSLNSSSGALTGTPTTIQVSTFSITVTDAAMATDTDSFSLTISGAATGEGVKRVGKVTSTGKVSQ